MKNLLKDLAKIAACGVVWGAACITSYNLADDAYNAIKDKIDSIKSRKESKESK